MQGEGTYSETLIPIHGEATLRIDEPDPGFDVPALPKAVHAPRIERWSGAAFDMPDELELFVVTSVPHVPFLYPSQQLVDQGVFTPAATYGTVAVGRGRQSRLPHETRERGPRRLEERCLRLRPAGRGGR